MSTNKNGQATTRESIRAVVDRLRARHDEITQAIYDRIREAVPDSVGARDPTYQTGVLTAVNAVLSYSLDAIEHEPGWSRPIPPEAAAQARRAARAGVSSGAVLRRYVAGHGRLGDFVTEETACVGLWSDAPALLHISSTHDALLGHFTAAIEHEHDLERKRIVQEQIAGHGPYAANGTYLAANRNAREVLELRRHLMRGVRARHPEINEAILARIGEISPGEPHHSDASYEHRERVAVTAVLDYLLSYADDNDVAMPIPPEAIAHAQSAARAGVRLDTIFRRYSAVGQLLDDHIMQEAERLSLSPCNAALRSMQWMLTRVVDRLIVSISDEHTSEAVRCRRSPECRLAERVRNLLAGDCAGAVAVDYDFDAWHLGAIVVGTDAAKLMADLAARAGCRLLFVTCDSNLGWAWSGAPSRASLSEIERALVSVGWPPGATLALGEAADGLDGWRLTHSQAQDAHLVSLRQCQRLTRYADVALVMPWLRDPARARWLLETYLGPLDGFRCPGDTLIETLRAYFAAGRNQSAAANRLAVSRRTMRNRMNLIEAALGRKLDIRQPELELALRLYELTPPPQYRAAGDASTERSVRSASGDLMLPTSVP